MQSYIPIPSEHEYDIWRENDAMEEMDIDNSYDDTSSLITVVRPLGHPFDRQEEQEPSMLVERGKMGEEMRKEVKKTPPTQPKRAPEEKPRTVSIYRLIEAA